MREPIEDFLRRALPERAVEDAPAIADCLVVAEDGPSALAELAKTPVDAIVTDQIMPKGMTGVELVRQARSEFPGLGFVIMSGYADALRKALDGRAADRNASGGE